MDYKRYIVARGLNRPTKELALDLIYAATELEFPIDKIILGTPLAVQLRPTNDEPDTYVTIKRVAGVFDDRYDTPAGDGVLYNRIPLSLIHPHAGVILTEPAGSFTIHQILDRINAKLGVQLSKEDLENDAYPSTATSITLRASPTSLVWLGTYSLTFGDQDEFVTRITESGQIRLTEDDNIRVLEEW
jgi:hypothetical protein